jgi:hypothetical protein
MLKKELSDVNQTETPHAFPKSEVFAVKKVKDAWMHYQNIQTKL